jgi:hypothetical protein
MQGREPEPSPGQTSIPVCNQYAKACETYLIIAYDVGHLIDNQDGDTALIRKLLQLGGYGRKQSRFRRRVSQPEFHSEPEYYKAEATLRTHLTRAAIESTTTRPICFARRSAGRRLSRIFCRVLTESTSSTKICCSRSWLSGNLLLCATMRANCCRRL